MSDLKCAFACHMLAFAGELGLHVTASLLNDEVYSLKMHWNYVWPGEGTCFSLTVRMARQQVLAHVR